MGILPKGDTSGAEKQLHLQKSITSLFSKMHIVVPGVRVTPTDSPWRNNLNFEKDRVNS